MSNRIMAQPMAAAPTIVLFDGVCNLCSAAVGFILRHERDSDLRFASLQSPLGQELMTESGRDPGRLDSIIVVRGDRFLDESDAVLEIAGHLRMPWRLARAGAVLPRGFRDWAYRRIARSRYRLFGKKDACMVPSPELRARFIDDRS